MNYKLNLAFEGTKYHGWQRQENAITVSEMVERAIEQIFKQKVNLTGCSRTDAGVHAISYVCNFKSWQSIPAEKIPLALNTKLPRDIRVRGAEIVDDGFNARFSALNKTYIYKTCISQTLSPFMRNYAYHFPYRVDMKKIKGVTKYFEGLHDFSGFMTQGSSQRTTLRMVNYLKARQYDDIIEFEINANSYLYNMVRIIAGTLLYVGIGKIDAGEIPYIIRSCDRSLAGITAEPQGLYLKEVRY